MKERKERRKNIRLPLAFRASLKSSKPLIHKGQSRNISFGGVFIELDRIPIVKNGDYFSLQLLSRVEFTCQVIHSNPAGIGLQFDFILIKYYEQFKKMMLNNAPDPDRMIKELRRKIEL